MISRQAAIDALDEQIRQCDKALSAFDISMKDEYAVKVERASLVAFRETLEYMPSAQPGCEDAVYRKAVQMLLAYFVPEERYAEAVDGLRRLPTAQPEIIHCKDCKYNPNPPECGNAACVLFYGMTDQMGFCHHGERRERE